MKFLPWRWDSSAMSMSLHLYTPLVDTSHGQVWYYFKQTDLWPDLWSDVPPAPYERHLMAKFGTTSSRLTPGRDICVAMCATTFVT